MMTARDDFLVTSDFGSFIQRYPSLVGFSCEPMISLAVGAYGDVPKKLIESATSDRDTDAVEREKLKSLRRALSVLREGEESIDQVEGAETQQSAIETYSLLRFLKYTPEEASFGLLASLMKGVFHPRKMDIEIGQIHTEISDSYSPLIANALCNLGGHGQKFNFGADESKSSADAYINAIGRPIGGRAQGRFEAQILPMVITFIDLHHGKMAGVEVTDQERLWTYRALLARRIDDVRNGRNLFLTLNEFLGAYRSASIQPSQSAPAKHPHP